LAEKSGGSKLEGMIRTIEELIPDYLRGLPVYIPGKPIEEVERELKIQAVKLASNENPLGPSPKGMAERKCCGRRWRSGGEFLRKRFL